MALFMATYPGQFVSEAWPTDDNVVPWKMFWVLVGRVQNVMAMRTLRHMQAVAQGIGMSFGGNDSGVRDALRELSEQAMGE